MSNATEFWGYLRPDGQVGTRNHLLVLAAGNCAYEEARRMAAAVPGAVAVSQWHHCTRDEMVERGMIGIGRNPNVGAVLVVGLGCESLTAEILFDGIQPCGKPIAQVVIQEVGGSLRAIEAGTRILREMAAELSRQRRQPFPLSKLTVAVECGGSDATSGLAANPAVGNAADRLVDAGATVYFGETIEMTGTEHILARRAVDAKTAQDIYDIIQEQENFAKASGIPSRHIQQGNMDGGLTTIEEKSLGAILKGGTRPIQGVLHYNRTQLELPARPGLYIQEGTDSDVPSVTSMTAAGATVTLFTSGRGSTTGHAILPVIKVTGNPATYEWLNDNMDVNAGKIILGQAGITDLGQEIYDLTLRVASGEKTKAEILGFEDFLIYRVDPVAQNLLRRCEW